MAKAVSGSQAGSTRVYTNDDGSVTVLHGGSVAWRNNNPGNIRYGATAKAAGAIGKDVNDFAIFPDYQSGIQGLANVLRKYGNLTIDQAMQKYAPSSENDTAAYTAFLKARGVPGDTLIGAFTPDQFGRLVNGIHVYEGWSPGATSGAGSDMGGPGSPVAAQRMGSQANPFPQRGAPVPFLAQSQVAEPAFGMTSWPPIPSSANVLPPDALPSFAGTPRVASVPFVDGPAREEQRLDHSPLAPATAPWTFSNRFGNWESVGGVSGPMTSGGSGGSDQAGDTSAAAAGGSPRAGTDLLNALQSARPMQRSGTEVNDITAADAQPSEGVPPTRRLTSIYPEVASQRPNLSASRSGPVAPSGMTGPSIGLPATSDVFSIGASPISYPPSSLRNAPGGIPGLLAQVGAFGPFDRDQQPAGGLLGLIQQYMRNNSDGATR